MVGQESPGATASSRSGKHEGFLPRPESSVRSRDLGSVPVRSHDGSSIITDGQSILSRWAEHSDSVLNQTSTSDSSVPNLIPNWAVNMDLIQPPKVDEVHKIHEPDGIRQSTRYRWPSSRGVQSRWSKPHHQADSSLSEHLEQTVGPSGI